MGGGVDVPTADPLTLIKSDAVPVLSSENKKEKESPLEFLVQVCFVFFWCTFSLHCEWKQRDSVGLLHGEEQRRWCGQARAARRRSLRWRILGQVRLRLRVHDRQCIWSYQCQRDQCSVFDRRQLKAAAALSRTQFWRLQCSGHVNALPVVATRARSESDAPLTLAACLCTKRHSD